MRKLLFLHLILVSLSGQVLAQRSTGPIIIPDTVALRHGLTRAWISQVQLDRAADHLVHVTQDTGMLFVQTQRAMVHVLDAETGRTIWAQQIGQRNHPGLPPGVNDKYVAIVNGTTLYVVNRADGRREWERRFDGAPGSGAALNNKYAFVPMVNGLMQGFQLEAPKETPWIYRSIGRVLIQPMMTPHTLSWTTNKGYFYVADTDKLGIRFRLETRDSIESQPAYWTPYLYACSMDGYIYCVEEATGQIAWKYPTGEPILQPPVAINGKVYVVPRGGMMYCLNGTNGELDWSASGVTQFISVSAGRVYVCDRLDRMLILDGKSGTRLDTMPLPVGSKRLINHQTDRIYLTTETGMIQCLREVELKQPLVYTPPQEEQPESKQQRIEKKVAEKSEKTAADRDADKETEKKAAVDAEAGESDAAEDDPFNK